MSVRSKGSGRHTSVHLCRIPWMEPIKHSLLLVSLQLPHRSSQTDNLQVVIVVVQSMVSTTSPNRLVSLHGIGSPTCPPKAMLKSTHSTPSKCKRLLLSSTAVSSSMTRHQH